MVNTVSLVPSASSTPKSVSWTKQASTSDLRDLPSFGLFQRPIYPIAHSNPPSPHFLSFSEIPARGRLFTENFVTTGGSWRFKQGFFLWLHTGKDFGSLLYVIPSGPLAQIDRQTSKVGRK